MLLFRALLAVARVRLELLFVPSSRVPKPLVPLPPDLEASPAAIAIAVARAARLVPGAACLVQALAARRLLARAGHFSTLHIGVRKQPHFAAHAWLECQGRIISGATSDSHETILSIPSWV